MSKAKGTSQDRLLGVVTKLHTLSSKIEDLSTEAPKYTKEDLGYLLNKISDHLRDLSVTVRELEEFFL